MGTIDKITATVTCPACNTNEEQSAVEYGSVYGSGGWGSFGKFEHFDVTIGNDQFGPSVVSATCKECAGIATIS